MKNEKYTDLRPCAVGEGHAPPGDALAARTNRRQNGKRPRFVIARRPQRGRGALSAKREEVPLGCNLGKALPNHKKAPARTQIVSPGLTKIRIIFS